jgi:myo-inositol-1-phosphate synthase
MEIRFAIVGVGNCASALLQGVSFYSDEDQESAAGLMHWCVGPYSVGDIRSAMVARDRGIAGPVLAPCAWLTEHPPRRLRDDEARRALERFAERGEDLVAAPLVAHPATSGQG